MNSVKSIGQSFLDFGHLSFVGSGDSNLNLPMVSVIVLNYNGKNYLNRCLSSLKRTKYPQDRYEILLVDNFSTDGSVAFVRAHFPWVKIVSFKKNYGFDEGNNKGVECAKGEYIAFLNNDTEVNDDWLIKLMRASIDQSASVCASKTLFMNNPALIHYGGAKFAINGRAYSVAFCKKNREEVLSLYTAYPCATAMLIKRDVFLKIGQFDESYFACLDDTDLGWRAWLSGYKVLYCPTSVVYHLVGGTTGRARITSLRAFHGTKNALMNILKNLEIKSLLQGLILAVLYDFVEFLLLIKRRDAECAGNKVKAYFWVIKNLHLIIKKRRVIQKKRRVSDKWLFDNGLMASLNESIHEYLRLSKLNSNTTWNV